MEGDQNYAGNQTANFGWDVDQRAESAGWHVGVSPAWIGGHGTEPYEQNTQQSPGFGLKSSPHPAQS